MGHQAAARRIAHPLGKTVDKPQGTNEIHKTDSGFAAGVHIVEQPVHLGTQPDDEVHHRREQQTETHYELFRAGPVGDEAIDEAGYSIDYSIEGQEYTKLGLVQSQLGLQRRHGDAEILPHEIEEGVPDHQDDQRPPLPIVVFLLDTLVHIHKYSELPFSLITIQPVHRSRFRGNNSKHQSLSMHPRETPFQAGIL